MAAPVSAVATIAGLDDFGDVADPVLASATQPSVAVKVIDKRHNAIYAWSLDRMQQNIQRMRNLTTYIDRPSYTQHFSSDEPFYDSPTPEYSFIGNALISLSPLFRRKWSSIYESLSDSKPPREKLMELYTKQIPHTQQIVLAGDHTAWPRLEAFTLKERTYEHQAQPMSGSKPVTLGQGYSTIVWIR